MWEKNGLRHGEFDIYNQNHETQIPEEKIEVQDIKWNSNSKIMAVEVSEEQMPSNSVVLFTFLSTTGVITSGF